MAVTVSSSTAGGPAVTIPANGPVNQALFDAVAAAINKASAAGGYTSASGSTIPAAPTVSGGATAVAVSTSGSVSVPAGYGTLLYTNNNAALTIQAAPGLDVLSGTGGITYYGTKDTGGAGGTSSVAAGGGPNLVSFDTGTLYNVSLGDGSDTVYANGSGLTDMAGGRNLYVGSSGSNTVFASGISDTLVATTGSETIGASGVNTSIYLGSGTALVGVTGPGATISAGTGAATIFAGDQSVTFLGKSSAPLFVAPGDASSTVVGGTVAVATVFGNGGSNITYFSAGAAGKSALLVAGFGNETINSSGSEVGNSLFAGTGKSMLFGGVSDDLLVGSTGSGTLSGGLGKDMFIFSKGAAGGTFTIADFTKADDSIVLSKYGSSEVSTALSGATVSGGSTLVSLSDGTKITFSGVTGLTADAFKTN